MKRVGWRADPEIIDLAQRLMHAITTCDEELDEDGVCECGQAIAEELWRFKRRAIRAEKRAGAEEKGG